MTVRDEIALQVFEKLADTYGYAPEFWDHWLDCDTCDPFGCGCCGDGCSASYDLKYPSTS